jgi:flagellin
VGLTVTTNLTAMTARRRLATSDGAMGRSLERLSTGFRINRAADDAAGLAISEGLRSQIRGATQAVRNTQDGISVVQTAEGALGETTSILQRMRDLAVQGANAGVLDGTATAGIQRELEQLKGELTRIASTTTFNGTPLLDGTYRGLFQVGADRGDSLTVTIDGSLGASGLGLDALDLTRTTDPEATMQAARGSLPDLDRGRLAFVGAATSPAGIASLTGKIQLGTYSLDLSTVDFTGASSVPDMVTRLNAFAAAASGFGYEADLFKADAEDLIFRGPMPASGASTTDLGDISPDYDPAGNEPTVRSPATTTSPPSAGYIFFPGRTAADITSLRGTVSVDGHTLDLGAVTYTDTDGDTIIDGDEALTQLNAAAAAAGLGGGFTDGPLMVLGDDVYDELPSMLRFTGPVPAASATAEEVSAASPAFVHLPDPITAIDLAIRAVSAQRADLGAAQNRFEHTLDRLGSSIENTSAAESRIRDADMALETTRFSRNQVMVQAGTAMLAQANQSTQQVLALLKA